MVHDVADRLRLPVHVVHRPGTEGHGAVLRGAVSNLSIAQTNKQTNKEHVVSREKDVGCELPFPRCRPEVCVSLRAREVVVVVIVVVKDTVMFTDLSGPVLASSEINFVCGGSKKLLSWFNRSH